MIAIDVPPKVGGLRILDVDVPASAEFENVNRLLFAVLDFELAMGEPNPQITFEKFASPEDAFREHPEPRKGNMSLRQGLDSKTLFVDYTVDLV